jgi:very-short-patch-repair endonuclease
VDDESSATPSCGIVVRVKVAEVMEHAGGVVDAGVLVAFTSRGKVRRAVGRGEIVRDRRGKYALPTAAEGRRAAHRLDGVMTGLTAAAHHGWEMKTQPDRPVITVPRGRKVPPARREGVDLRWRTIPDEEHLHGVLLPGPTVIDCARTRPFDEALAIAESALRHSDVTSAQLRRLANQVRTTGRAQAIRVAEVATGRTANPFESVLYAISLDVPGLDLQPQVVIAERGFVGRPDLVDVARRVVAEAESFEFHGDRRALRRDCRRYTALVLLGWRVVRFTWEDVMFRPGYVRECLELLADLARQPQRRTPRPGSGRIPA